LLVEIEGVWGPLLFLPPPPRPPPPPPTISHPFCHLCRGGVFPPFPPFPMLRGFCGTTPRHFVFIFIKIKIKRGRKWLGGEEGVGEKREAGGGVGTRIRLFKT